VEDYSTVSCNEREAVGFRQFYKDEYSDVHEYDNSKIVGQINILSSSKLKTRLPAAE